MAVWVIGGVLFVLLTAGGAKLGVDVYKSRNALSSRTVSIEAKIELTKDGDNNKDGKINGGDTLRFSFVLTNTSKAEAKFLTLDSGIATKSLYFVRNYKGVNGSTVEGGKLLFKNVVILPRQTQTIGFDASLVYDTKDTSLVFVPVLLESDSKQLAKGNQVFATIDKTEATDVPSMAIVKQQEGD